MTTTVRSDDADRVTYDVLVDNKSRPEVLVSHIEVDIEVNKLPRAYVTCSDGDASAESFPVSQSDVFDIGATIELKLGYHSKNKTVFKGIVLGQTVRRHVNGNSDCVVICGDKAETLALRTANHAYLESNDGETMGKIAREAGLASRIEGARLKSPSQILAHSSAWDYVLARAEANGLVVLVDAGQLIIGPPGQASAKLHAEFGDTISQMNLTVDASQQVSGVSVQSWDYKSQAPLIGTASEPALPRIGSDKPASLAKVAGDAKPLLSAQSPLAEDELKAWANARLLRSRLSACRGMIEFSGTADLKAGDVLELKGLGKRFNGSGYVSRLVQRFGAGQWFSEAHIGLDPEWLADRGGGIDARPANGLRPSVSGLQICTVLQTDQDPDGERRIKVSSPLNSDTSSGIWVRLASLYASKDAGCVFLPEVGDEVVVGYLDDDPNAGIILGAMHSNKKPAPLVPDEQNTKKEIKTRSGLTVAFDDDKKILTILTPGGHKAVLSDEAKSILIEDSNSNKLEMAEGGITMSSPRNITIKATGSVGITGDTGVTIKSDADVSAQGLNAKMKGELSATVDGGASATLSGGAEAKVQAAMVMIN